MKIIMSILIGYILIGFLSCIANDRGNDYIIDSTRIGDIKLCDNISSVLNRYKTYIDTSFTSDEEGVTWIGKKILLSDNYWILIESSWIDSTKIWRISTNSPKYQTINGYQIGDMVSKIKANHDDISFYESEAGFELKSKMISFGFSIDSKYTDDFYKKVVDCNNCPDYLKFIDDNAMITEIIISGDCSK
jgi:hypothetical protein